MNKETICMLDRLVKLGTSIDHACALRRISMTLHHWHEYACGIGEHDTYYIEREDGRPFMHSANTGRKWPIPDRETGALKRLAKIMANYPAFGAYVQTDPRGPALYIYKQSDLAGRDIESCYFSIGIAVFK